MDKDLETRLRELLDKQEIHEILLTYCRGVDRRDTELIARAYHPDAVDDHGDFVVAARDIPALFTALAGRPANGGMHLVANSLIEVEGDTAWAESYFLAIKDADDAGRSYLRIRAGRYVDRFERREGSWAIAERVVVDEWNKVDEITARTGPRENYRFGRRDRSDIVYTIRDGIGAREPTSDVGEVSQRKVFR